jgi:hypothetical protein
LLLASSTYPSLQLLIKDSVGAIGFQVALYYSLSGYACAWHFRSVAFKSFRQALFLFFWPAASASFLVFIGLYSIPTFDNVALMFGIGGIVVGVVPWALNRRRAHMKRSQG